MAFNGSGVYSLASGNPVVTGTTISSTWANDTLTDIANNGLTKCLTKDGQSTPTANIPLGGFKITGLAAGTATTDATNLTQVQAGAYAILGAVAGTDTITASATPTLAAYANGNTFRLVAAGTNTGATTLNINSLGAKAITKNGTTALGAGDIPSGAMITVVYDGTQFQLMNIGKPAAFVDTNPIVKGSADATKQFRFEVDTNQPTAATVVVTTQSTNGTMELVESQIKPITASVAANALTLTLNPCALAFRSATLTSGAVNVRAVNSAISVIVSSGSTLGTINAQAARLALVAIDNAGTVELAVINLAGGNQLDETNLISTTAEGGAGAADSNNIFYSTTARTSVPYRVVGFVDITEATAGTWATAPSTIQGYGGQALAALASLGYGQTWQNVLGSRAFGTTYTNTSGKPIQLAVYATATVGGVISYSINGVIQGQSSQSGGAGYGLGTLTPIVPHGATYLVTNVTSATLVYWFELR